MLLNRMKELARAALNRNLLDRAQYNWFLALPVTDLTDRLHLQNLCFWYALTQRLCILYPTLAIQIPPTGKSYNPHKFMDGILYKTDLTNLSELGRW